jgi:CDP-glucose 4,6-dehydratase
LDLHQTFNGKKVFLTGHTGFKGAWLTVWLLRMGAKVSGYSLEPDIRPGLLEQLDVLDSLHSHKIADIRDHEMLKRELLVTNPDFVFHLAAQPLVRRSYREPVETYMTNVIGTIAVLEAMRELEKPCVGVFITTDKCYENQENGHYYAETDALGGYDPYSSSKACAELAIASWRRSFFQVGNPVNIASARAGNVIGGGDWSEDRIVPDAIRYLKDGKPVPVRNPHAVRPWQHVLEPLHGYLLLAKAIENAYEGKLGIDKFSGAFNFGPNDEANRSVKELVREIFKHWPGSWENLSKANNVHEASLLHLDISKAKTLLGWRPAWDFSESIAKTVEWYRYAINNDGSLYEFTLKQICEFESEIKIIV